MKINFEFRNPITHKKMNLSVETRGEGTHFSVAVLRDKRSVIGTGSATRSPDDTQDYKLGRTLAIKRAIKAAANADFVNHHDQFLYYTQDFIKKLIHSYTHDMYSAFRKAEREGNIKNDLGDLAGWFNNGEEPNVGAIEDAQDILKRYARRELPDWVEALANGNPDCIASVYEVAREQVKAEGLWPEQ